MRVEDGVVGEHVGYYGATLAPSSMEKRRQAFFGRIKCGAFGDRPGFQCPIGFESQIVVQSARLMALHVEARGRRGDRRAGSGFGSLLKAAFAPVFI